MKYFILLFFLATSLTYTCNTKMKSTAIANNKSESQTVPKSKFQIVMIDNKRVSAEKLHITFDDERNSAYGYSGCNTFSSSYKITGDSISFGFPIATKIYCEKTMDIEQDFFKNLMESKVRVLSKDSLILKDTSGKALLTGIKFTD